MIAENLKLRGSLAKLICAVDRVEEIVRGDEPRPLTDDDLDRLFDAAGDALSVLQGKRLPDSASLAPDGITSRNDGR